MIPIKVNGNTYKSISEAWRELSPEGLPEITVRWRLRNGWDVDWAFEMPPVPKHIRRNYKRLREDN